ncbi:MAG TPA: hypothetical protein EYP04_06300 [Anaerolineae bacterium]|nr:hypothetical protein [Anaerolineae bacterium]HIQ05369.1 hypothetical protein [Anaerolineae bacterium]
MTTVGIPRALDHYELFPQWRAFFQALGWEVRTSPPTNRAILAQGVARTVGEMCLPVKVYLGHALALHGQVDWLFVPARRRGGGGDHCSKIIGLPDIVRTALPDGGRHLLTVEVETDSAGFVIPEVLNCLAHYCTRSPLRRRRAIAAAQQAHTAYRAWLEAGASIKRAMAQAATGKLPSAPAQPVAWSDPSEQMRIAVVAHPYCLHDEYINHSLLRRLKQMGADVVTAEQVPQHRRAAAIIRLAGSAYWAYAWEMIGAGGHYLSDSQVDGVIAVAAFGCAPDSGLLETLRTAAVEIGRPFMTLIVDEHSGEAGVITRLEAFVDMLERRHQHTGGYHASVPGH